MGTNKFSKTHGTLTEADIKAVEERMGFKLPDELRSHYLQYNGGEPERRCWKSAHWDDMYLNAFFPMRKLSDLRNEEMDNLETLDAVAIDLLEQKQLPESFIPFAADAGGNYFCIDRTDGKVYFFVEDESGDFDTRKRFLASSLTKFISGLAKGDNKYL